MIPHPASGRGRPRRDSGSRGARGPLTALALTALVVASCSKPEPPRGLANPPPRAAGSEPSDPDAPAATAAAPATDGSAGPHASASGDAAPPGDARPPLPDPETPLPAALLRVLAPKPYVEEHCQDEPSFGFEAKRCRYSAFELDAEVLVADPEPERVGRWLVDAARFCAPLEALRLDAPVAWERGVVAFAKHVRYQSSRIFPLRGDIVEDLGAGPTVYRFDRGVVSPCDGGNCRCRINSLTPAAYCAFVGDQGGDEPACLRTYSGAKGDAAWRDACAENHRTSLARPDNPHFRARAWLTGKHVERKCAPPRRCRPDEVVALIERDLRI